MPSAQTIISMTPAHVCVPLERPLKVATFEVHAIDTCCVTLRTKEGLKGHGWCFAFGPERTRAMIAMVRDLFANLLGKDPAEAETELGGDAQGGELRRSRRHQRPGDVRARYRLLGPGRARRRASRSGSS